MEIEVTELQAAPKQTATRIFDVKGGTVWLDGDVDHSRYVVGDGRRGIRCDATLDNVRRWIVAACVDVYAAEGVGFWINNGTLYVDPVRTYNTFRAAEIQAQRNREHAIWDRQLQREITVSDVSAHIASDS